MSKQEQISNMKRFRQRIDVKWKAGDTATLATAKTYADSAIAAAIAGIESFDPVVLDHIPTVQEAKKGKIYFVHAQSGADPDYYNEYVLVGNDTIGYKVELIGSSMYRPDHTVDTTSIPGKVVVKKNNRSFAVDSVEIIVPQLIVKYDNVLFEGDSKAVTTTDKTGNITFECTNIQDADIYYTLDGTDPEESETRIEYNGENVTIGITTTGDNKTTNTVLKVAAYKLGSWSEVRTITFAITRKLKKPTISVANPTRGQTQGVVTITNPNGRGVVRYTTNGTKPNASSPEFTSLSVNTKTWVRAAVFLDNWVTSDVTTYYTIFTVLTPNISVGGNFYDASRTITVSCGTPSASLTYQTSKDGGEWSQATSITSEGTFTLDTNGSYQVKVSATKTDWNGSENESSSFNVRKVQTPTITVSPGTGTEWDDARQIEITAGSAGGDLKYSTDGGTTWNDYSAPFNVSAPFNGKIKAKAIKTDYTDSNVAESSTITLKLKCYIGRTAVGTSTVSALSELLDKKTINDDTLVGREESNTFTASGRIWFIVPSGKTITKVTSGGYLVPVELVANQISGYNCYRRVEDDNAGTYTYNFE